MAQQQDEGYAMNEFEEPEEQDSAPKPELLTQHYLQLRNQGRLTSAGTGSRPGSSQQPQPHTARSLKSHRPQPAFSAEVDDEECLCTVYHAEQQRLKFLTDSMAFQPLPIPRGSSRGGSQRSLRPGTHQSWSSQVLKGHSLPQYRSPPSPSARHPADEDTHRGSPPASDRPATSAPPSRQQQRPQRQPSPPEEARQCASPGSRSAQSMRSHYSSLSALNIRSKTCPGRPIYSPGPGAYSPSTDRYGSYGAPNMPKAAFGTAPQRPANVCLNGTGVDSVSSPGPAYLPSAATTTARPTSPRFSFGKKEIGSRSDPCAGHPSNAPLWNPGPGNYVVQRLATGVFCEPGQDAPHAVFGASPKLMTPQTNLSATPFVSAGHALKENAGIHSPGPARYSPDTSPTRTSPAKYTMAKKAPSYFDAFLDPSRQLSPGPAYSPTVNNRAERPWTSQSATFGKATKFWDPELNLSSAPFISHIHAHHVNKGIHAPGVGSYRPRHSQPRVPSPLLSSGPKDRFYDRFEPGRLG